MYNWGNALEGGTTPAKTMMVAVAAAVLMGRWAAEVAENGDNDR